MTVERDEAGGTVPADGAAGSVAIGIPMATDEE